MELWSFIFQPALIGCFEAIINRASRLKLSSIDASDEHKKLWKSSPASCMILSITSSQQPLSALCTFLLLQLRVPLICAYHACSPGPSFLPAPHPPDSPLPLSQQSSAVSSQLDRRAGAPPFSSLPLFPSCAISTLPACFDPAHLVRLLDLSAAQSAGKRQTGTRPFTSIWNRPWIHSPLPAGSNSPASNRCTAWEMADTTVCYVLKFPCPEKSARVCLRRRGHSVWSCQAD